jgi:hypothetical protein
VDTTILQLLSSQLKIVISQRWKWGKPQDSAGLTRRARLQVGVCPWRSRRRTHSVFFSKKASRPTDCLTSSKSGKYTHQFVQPEHFSDLQIDKNTFSNQFYLLVAKFI